MKYEITPLPFLQRLPDHAIPAIAQPFHYPLRVSVPAVANPQALLGVLPRYQAIPQG